MTTETVTSPAKDQLDVPFSRVSTFIRQVTHDVRNSLNAIDLQAAYAVELVTDPEAGEEVRRVRQLIQQCARQLHSLSAQFWPANPNQIEYSARLFTEDLRDRLAKLNPEQAVETEWDFDFSEKETISIDIELVFTAVGEVFANALHFREGTEPLRVRASVASGDYVLEVQERKSVVPGDPAEWGKDPFISTRRGGYGLGLFRAHAIMEAHGGVLTATHDAAQGLLTSRVLLPLVPA